MALQSLPGLEKWLRAWISSMSFSTVIWIVVLVVAPIAAVLFAGAFGLLDQLGRGGLAIDEPPPSGQRGRSGPSPGGALERAEREAEIRQLVQARHDRQAGRGEQPVDVDVEVARLLALDAEHDPAGGPSEQERQDELLRIEIRQLVIARNERRAARGEPPLDVEAEVERQLRDLGGS
jgi:hypothetical protein